MLNYCIGVDLLNPGITWLNILMSGTRISCQIQPKNSNLSAKSLCNTAATTTTITTTTCPTAAITTALLPTPPQQDSLHHHCHHSNAVLHKKKQKKTFSSMSAEKYTQNCLKMNIFKFCFFFQKFITFSKKKTKNKFVFLLFYSHISDFIYIFCFDFSLVSDFCFS